MNTEAKLDRIIALLEQIAGQRNTPSPDLPTGPNARLHILARQDPQAAIAEAKRLSRAYTKSGRAGG